MESKELEDLLVDWEIARQDGSALSVETMCSESPEFAEELEAKIQILRDTEWMLEDPTPLPFSEPIRDSVTSFVQSMVQGEPTDLSSADTNEDFRHLTNQQVHLDSVRSELADVGFELEEELGRGGYGAVFQALDQKLNRRVAIKIPLIDDERSRSRYLREARNAALVEGDGLIPVLQVAETESGTPYVVQKLISGTTLHGVIKEQAPLSTDKTCELLESICDACARAHEQSLVHRDLKPGNILIDEQGVPWIADFGLAVTEEDVTLGANPRRQVAGTLSYMSPEQLEGNVERIDGRSDIWAIGVILYECLTGARPFRGTDDAELIDQIRRHDPRPMSQRRPGLSPEWDAVFVRCCAKKPGERYANAAELRKQILEVAKPSESRKTRLSKSTLAVTLSALVGTAALAFGVSHWLPTSGSSASAKTGSAPPLPKSTATLKPKSEPHSPDADPKGATQQLRPLVVSSVEPGGFASISEAISYANSNTGGSTSGKLIEIRVKDGKFGEAIEVQSRLSLIAETGAERIEIECFNEPAFRIKPGGQLRLTGFKFGEKVGGSPINLVEVQDGILEIEDCAFRAETLNCVRAENGSEISIVRSDLTAMAHPAVYVSGASILDVRECTLAFQGEESLTSKCLQVRSSGGTVSNCRFAGSNATGIDWFSTAALVHISDCSFSNLRKGVAAQGCDDLLVDSPQGETKFLQCGFAVHLEACAAKLQDIYVDAEDRENAVGGYVRNQNPKGPVTILNSKFRRLESGLQITNAIVNASIEVLHGNNAIQLTEGADLDLRNSHVASCRNFGLQIERGSSAELETVEFHKCGYGIEVLSGSAALDYTGGLIKECEVGMTIASGDATLENVDILEVDTGVLIGRPKELGAEISAVVPIRLATKGGEIHAKIRTVQFISPGSLKKEGTQLLGADKGRMRTTDDLQPFIRDGIIVVKKRR